MNQVKLQINNSKFNDENHKINYFNKIVNNWIEIEKYTQSKCYNYDFIEELISDLITKYSVRFIDKDYNIYTGIILSTTPNENDDLSIFEPKYYFTNINMTEKYDLNDIFNLEDYQHYSQEKDNECRGFYYIPFKWKNVIHNIDKKY